MDSRIVWLLESEPWVEYNTRRYLLNQSEHESEVISARERMINSAAVKKIINEISDWPASILISHKSAGHSLHKLVFLADLGMKADDAGMSKLVHAVMSHQDSEGPYQMLTNISAKYGGSGEDIWAWALCDAPLLLYALVRFGLENEPGVKKGIERLKNLVRENGWPCAGSTKYGTFRGPGRKIDPCPFANLIMLKVLASIAELRDDKASHLGTESILSCWAERESYHPYIFYMGTDFCKLKAPLVWYDILNVVTVLTQFPRLKEDERLKQMVSIIEEKADTEGRFTPESVWLAWKDWDFGQKKNPSPWLTYLALGISARSVT